MLSLEDCAFTSLDAAVYMFRDVTERSVRLAYAMHIKEAYDHAQNALAGLKPQTAFALWLLTFVMKHEKTGKTYATDFILIVPSPTDIDVQPKIDENYIITTNVNARIDVAPTSVLTKAECEKGLSGLILDPADISQTVGGKPEDKATYIYDLLKPIVVADRRTCD